MDLIKGLESSVNLVFKEYQVYISNCLNQRLAMYEAK